MIVDITKILEVELPHNKLEIKRIYKEDNLTLLTGCHYQNVSLIGGELLLDMEAMVLSSSLLSSLDEYTNSFDYHQITEFFLPLVSMKVEVGTEVVFPHPPLFDLSDSKIILNTQAETISLHLSEKNVSQLLFFIEGFLELNPALLFPLAWLPSSFSLIWGGNIQNDIHRKLRKSQMKYNARPIN